MRILITTDVIGGVWNHTEELVDALLARGHAPGLVLLGGAPGARHQRWLDRHATLPVTVLPCPLEWEPEPEPGLSDSARAIADAIDAFAPDVVHFNQMFYGAFDFGVPALVAAHSDVVSWWHALEDADPPDDEWFARYRKWVGEGLRGADLRAAPSAWIAGQIEEIYGCGAVHVVHNGRSARDRTGMLDAPSRPAMAVTVGRLWDEGKGARDLIAAARRAGDRVRFVVAGPVRHPAGGDDFPAGAPGVDWLGILDEREIRRLLARAAIYVAPSRYEPFGLAPLEAALAGCALVLSDIATFRELWDGCAAFFPPGDADALAAAVLDLTAERGRLDALAAAARARALERYSPDRMAAGYEALYRRSRTIP